MVGKPYVAHVVVAVVVAVAAGWRDQHGTVLVAVAVGDVAGDTVGVEVEGIDCST